MEKLSQNYKYSEETKLMKLFKKKEKSDKMKRRMRMVCHTRKWNCSPLFAMLNLYPVMASITFPSPKVWGIPDATIYVFVYIY